MNHSFDIDVAIRYGVNAAVLLNNIYFWCEHNRANGTNFHDGHYWTYNSRKAFSELFPYMTQRSVATALDKLIDDGIIITGNYNQSAYDRTMWYAVTEKGKSMLQKCKMEKTESENGNSQNVEPIPYINTDKNQSYNTYINEFEELWKKYPKKAGKEMAKKAYIKARKDHIEKETIETGLDKYIKYLKEMQTEERFIKNGSTWFNQHCWNDEYRITHKNPINEMQRHDWDYDELERLSSIL